jgi:hypothetical protein
MKTIIMIALLALAGNAYAVQGGEGNNTGCNGQGNPNSPCEGNDNGGKRNGGPDGIGFSYYGGDTAILHGGTTATTTVDTRVSNSTVIEAPKLNKRVPDAIAPSIGIYNDNSCLKPRSGAGSGAGFGLSFGGTVEDKQCEIRMTADILRTFGLEDEAVQALCQSEYVQKAAEAAAKKYGKESICGPVKAPEKKESDFDFYG